MSSSIKIHRLSETTNRLSVRSFANSSFSAAVKFWFVVTVIGQWVFLFYLVAFYGPSTFSGNFEAWRKNAFPIKSYVPGDTVGNLAFAAHALLAAVIAFGGTVQLIRPIRERAIAVHRWVGRVFLVTALGLSVSGFYMVWARPHTVLTRTSTSINAAFIIAFSLMTWRTAMKRQVAAHNRWALRTFLVSNAQWFARVGIFAWMILSRGRGIGDNFDGPFVVFWSYGCYMVPLLVLETYLRTKEKGSGAKLAFASSLAVLTLITGLGVTTVSMIGWVPSVRAALDSRKSINETLSTVIKTNGIGEAVRVYHNLKATRPGAYHFEESELNRLGTSLINTKNYKEAIIIFQLNAEAYPQSSGVYAGLAEAYMNDGNATEAIANCQKSLQLNPQSRRALRVLQKLSTSGITIPDQNTKHAAS